MRQALTAALALALTAACGGSASRDASPATEAGAGGAQGGSGGLGGSAGIGGAAGPAGTGGAAAGATGGSTAGCQPPCGANQTCVESGGTPACQCNPGYAPDGPGCVDVDECASGTHNCDLNAACTNTSGAFNCTCKPGYTGDGLTCSPTGNYTCSSSTVISALPFTTTGDTTGAANNHAYPTGVCPGESGGWGGAAPEHVYSFTPSSSGEFQISLIGKGFDSSLYVVKDCSSIATTCLAADEQPCSSCTETVTLWLAAGVTYYVIVDGWSNTDPMNAGPYTLEVVRLGLCDSPKVVSSVPFSATGDTETASNHQSFSAGACPGESGGWGKAASDEVFAFNPPTTGQYKVSLTGQSFDSALYVATDCSSVDTSCIAANQLSCSNCTESVTIGATSGTTYFIVVDGYSNTSVTNAGMYTLKVENVALPGDNCASAFVVNSIPFTASGNTTGADADYGYSSGACPGEPLGWGKGAPDHVYAFTPGVTGSYTISLTGQAFDSNLYVVTDCTSVDTSCIAANEQKCFDCTESVTITLNAGTTYFIVVDGWQPFATTIGGAYTLTIQ
jgi:hypothetical protein